MAKTYMKKTLFPITHKFIIKTPPVAPSDGVIFEYYNRHDIPDIPGIEGCTSINGSVALSYDVWQAATIEMHIRTDTNWWGWAAFPFGEERYMPNNIRAHSQGHRRWMSGSPFISDDSAEVPWPDWGYVQDAIGRPESNMWSGWHPNPPPMPNLDFPYHLCISTDGIVWAEEREWVAHTWMYNVEGVSPLPRSNYVFWIRGRGNLDWPSSLRSLTVSDTVSTGWTPTIRRLPLTCYLTPWERYPSL